MAAVIVYNSKTITFPKDPYRIQIDMNRKALTNISASGIQETLNVCPEVIVSIGFRNFVNSNSTDATLKRNIQQWLMYAWNGGEWVYASDSAEQVHTTISGAEDAGQTAISLTSTSGIDVAGLYVIKSLAHQELVKIVSVDAGPAVTLTETLNHGYPSGSRFRSAQYWKGKLIGDTNPIIDQQNGGLHWDLELNFREDVNTL